MSPEQPSQLYSVPRTDAGARKLVSEVHALRSQLGGFLTHKQALWATLGSLAAVGALVVWLLGEARAKGVDGAAEAVSTARAVKVDLDAHKLESAARDERILEELKEQRIDFRHMYRSVRSGQPSARLSKDVP